MVHYLDLTTYFLLALSLTSAYFVTFTWIIHEWGTYKGTHGPVILAISLYMIWSKRQQIRQLLVRPNFISGICLTMFGCLLLILARVSSTLLLQYLSLIITLSGLVLLIWGTDHLKILWLPIVYLMFMFSLFSELLGYISIYLQDISTWIAYIILKLVRIPAVKSGEYIYLQDVTLEIARECNGINHIMALVGLSILLAYRSQNTFRKRALLIISAFFVGIFANGLRVAIIGIWIGYNKGNFAHGPFNAFYIPFIFFFGMLVIIGLNKIMMEKDIGSDAKDKQYITVKTDHRITQSRIVLSHIIAIILLLMTGGYLHFNKSVPRYLEKPLSFFPTVIGSWTGKEASFTGLPFNYFSADEELKRIYTDNQGDEIKLYIGYFPHQDEERKIVSYKFDFLQQNANKIQIPLGNNLIEIKSTEFAAKDTAETVYFFYDINGRILVNRYVAKLATIYDAIRNKRTNASIVVISFHHQSDDPKMKMHALEFIRDAFPLIQRYLKA